MTKAHERPGQPPRIVTVHRPIAQKSSPAVRLSHGSAARRKHGKRKFLM